MKKNINNSKPLDISLNSLNPHSSYHEHKPSNNNIFYNTTSNFRTNLYKKEFKNITVNNNNQKISNIKEIKKMTKEQIKNYIIYLKKNINSSHYANKELNNEYNKLLIKLRKINELIKNNNELYYKMNDSFKINLEKNKKNKDTYINIIDQYQLYNTKGENKNNNLNQIINSQENDIIKLINENNKLTNDINNKKNLIKYLQNIIELEKYKQIFIDLNGRKDELMLNNENINQIKEIQNKNEELKLNRDTLKNELLNKEKDNIEIEKIKQDLIDKINLLSNKDDNSSNNYQKLIEEENEKSKEINNKLEKKENELKNLKNKINLVKIKNEEEINTLSKYINELNSNNEKIKNEIEQRKKNALDKRLMLLKYNQEFKDTLIYKNNIISKIEEIKKENEDLKNRKIKIFNIKTIKSQNKNKINEPNISKKIKHNLTEPNLNKHNINKNIKLKQKCLSYNNILNNNQQNINKSLDISSNPRSGKFIYTIDNKGKLLSYGIDIKKFIYINTSSIKGWKYFYSLYNKNSEGSLFLNTFGGLFILTGDNYNQLFYYSQYKNMIYLIKSFKTNHKYGGMLLTKDGSKIIILGGEYNNSVILFNLQKNEVINLPNLIHKRINSSYNILNDRYIFSFFGKGNNTIEYLDLNNNKNNSWNILNYKSNGLLFKELDGHIGFNIEENIIIIIGGNNNENVLIFYLKEKFLDITDIKVITDKNSDIKKLYFDKEKCFNTIEDNNNREIIGMDNEGNVHCFNDDYAYTIFVS